MKLGVTGHQHRNGSDWDWVKRTVRAEISKLSPVEAAYSSLAVGADQLFADVACRLGIPTIAVLPLENYERFFKGAGLRNYRRLLKQASVVRLKWQGDEEKSFFEAGKYIVDACDHMLAIWDGLEAAGLGGTADIVDYARPHKGVTRIDPVARIVEHL